MRDFSQPKNVGFQGSVCNALRHISTNESSAYIKQDIRRLTSFRSQSLKMATRCNIELGNDRYVQGTEWSDQLRIDIREGETKHDKRVPTKKKNQSPSPEMEVAGGRFRVSRPGPSRT